VHVHIYLLFSVDMTDFSSNEMTFLVLFDARVYIFYNAHLKVGNHFFGIDTVVTSKMKLLKMGAHEKGEEWQRYLRTRTRTRRQTTVQNMHCFSFPGNLTSLKSIICVKLLIPRSIDLIFI
jgi:hypothetical protein